MFVEPACSELDKAVTFWFGVRVTEIVLFVPFFNDFKEIDITFVNNNKYLTGSGGVSRVKIRLETSGFGLFRLLPYGLTDF